MQRRLGQIDLTTGEVIENGFVAYVAPKKLLGFPRWVAMSQDALSVMKNFTRVEDFRVLMALLEHLDFENLIATNQAEIAHDLGMNKSQVNRAIRRLREVGALLEGPKIGVCRSYRLNPEFGWRGSARNHVIALRTERERRIKNARITGVIDGGSQPKSQPERDPNTPDLFD